MKLNRSALRKMILKEIKSNLQETLDFSNYKGRYSDSSIGPTSARFGKGTPIGKGGEIRIDYEVEQKGKNSILKIDNITLNGKFQGPGSTLVSKYTAMFHSSYLKGAINEIKIAIKLASNGRIQISEVDLVGRYDK